MQIAGYRDHGKSRKKWCECVIDDLDAFRLHPSDAKESLFDNLCDGQSTGASLPCSAGAPP